MKEMKTVNDITADIVDAAIHLHKTLGPGLLESVYELLLGIELEQRGYKVERQKALSIDYRGVHIDNAFRMDMVIEGRVVIELKSTEKMHPVYAKQLKTYLVLANKDIGLLLNFGMGTMVAGIERVVNNFRGN